MVLQIDLYTKLFNLLFDRIFIPHMRKLRHKEDKELDNVYINKKWQTGDASKGVIYLPPMLSVLQKYFVYLILPIFMKNHSLILLSHFIT